MSTDKTLADVQPGFTTGHCQHNNRPGGCQLHNLQCGWPKCYRKAVEPSLADVQPGGRVRLGDQALRVFSAGRWTYDGTGQSFSHEEMDAAAFVVYRDAALSAQPSPGGQDALIDALADDVESCVSDACGYLASDSGWDDYGIYRDDAAERYHALPDRVRALAARQPVGEPVGHLFRVVASDEGAAQPWKGRNIVYTEGPAPVEGRSGFGQYMNVYAAPTEQAVDLERFRGTVKSQYSMTEWMHRCGFVSAEKLEESKKNHDHLMALIDSKAVGK